MANITKKIVGNFSGALGDLTFKQLNGKVYAATRPKGMRPTNNPDTLKRRARFRLTVKSAKEIYKIPELQQLWSNVDTGSLSLFNYIVRMNYQYLGSAGSAESLVITPEEGFGIKTVSSSVSNSEIGLSVEPLGNLAGIDTAAEPKFQLISLMYLSDPVDDSYKAFDFIQLKSLPVASQLDSQADLTIQLMSQDTTKYDKYQNHVVRAALMTLDAAGIPVHYSNTFTIT